MSNGISLSAVITVVTLVSKRHYSITDFYDPRVQHTHENNLSFEMGKMARLVEPHWCHKCKKAYSQLSALNTMK